MYRRPRCEILFVEDNSADIRLIKEAFGECADCALHFCTDGAQALAFLRRESVYESVERPNLVVLDLNLPQIDGREVLRQIRENENLRQLPVLILSTSESQRDIKLAYQLGATCFLTKPQDLDGFFALMQSLYSFWAKWTVYPEDTRMHALV